MLKESTVVESKIAETVRNAFDDYIEKLSQQIRVELSGLKRRYVIEAIQDERQRARDFLYSVIPPAPPKPGLYTAKAESNKES